jgi:hypothetical protein
MVAAWETGPEQSIVNMASPAEDADEMLRLAIANLVRLPSSIAIDFVMVFSRWLAHWNRISFRHPVSVMFH